MEVLDASNAAASNDGPVPGGGGNAKAPSCGAVALLEKYSALNTGIDDSRRRTAATRSRIESLNSQTELRKSERREMVSRKEEAKADAALLGGKLKESRCKTEAIVQARGVVARDRGTAKEDLENTHRRVDNERDVFLQQRREFRRKCKRIRLEAAALATRPSVETPKSHSKGRDEIGKPLCTENLLDFCASSSEEEDDEECDHDIEDGMDVTPKKGTEKINMSKRDGKLIIDNDSELLDAISLARSASESRSEAKRGLDDALSSQIASSKRADDRARKLEQQRSQLERVRRDIGEMRREIEQLEREAREAREMGDGYEKDAGRRKRMTRDGNPGRPHYNTGSIGVSSNLNSRQGASFSKSFNLEDECYFDEEEDGLTPSSQSAKKRGASFAGQKGATSTITPSPRTANAQGQGYGRRANPYQTPNQNSSSSNSPKNAAVSNPYARTANTASNPCSSGNGGRRATSALERQHPHRSGRIRTERRFGTALEIFCSETEDGEDGTEEDRSRSIGRTKSVFSEDDDDDDDNDELLSFAAFKK